MQNKNYKEILKFDKMLTEAGIPHELIELFDGWQVTGKLLASYLSCTEFKIWSMHWSMQCY